jgi:Excalibur calcium-binding domain
MCANTMAHASPPSVAVAVLMLTWTFVTHAAGPVYKCVVNGTVTFQSSPCAAEKPSRRPTIDELNAERKKRLSEAAAKPTAAPPEPQSLPNAGSKPVELQPAPTPARDPGFRCDGRQHCSQMRSCAEAKYFLANCPGAKMDGNRDGTPCEQQWCTHPFAK